MELDGRSFQMIFGFNGSIWVSPEDPSGMILIPRIRNCLLLLATYERPVCADSLHELFDLTLRIEPKAILSSETAQKIGFALEGL
jgi:hypothetical protein